MMDAACAAPEKIDSIYFKLKNNATGLWALDENGKNYNYLMQWSGNGWMNFVNLPAGTYTVTIGKATTSNTGIMPFAVQALGANAAIGLV